MCPARLHDDAEQRRAAVERLGRPRLGREERQRGGARPGRAQLLRHAVLAPHPGHRVRERAGVPGRAEGALPPDHHQLPGGEPGGGRPAGGLSGHAVGRVPGGEGGSSDLYSSFERGCLRESITWKIEINDVLMGQLLSQSRCGTLTFRLCAQLPKTLICPCASNQT